MQELAERLSTRFGGASAFFCNSGAEAVEAALKWARKVTGRVGIVALEGSFHGRTLGALSVTGQPAKRVAFEPLVPGVRFVSHDGADALATAVGPDTAAILLEPVQGEGGIHPLEPEFVQAARMLADEHGALLVVDEVQTGVGRTGAFFAFEQLGVRPDAVTLAKGLANGLPIGCLLVSDEAPTGFEPGDHASTFGGNPVACAAACAVVDTIDDQLLAQVRASGDRLARDLAAIRSVTEVRGRGLLIAADVDRPAPEIVSAALERGLLVGAAGERTVRISPPLTIATSRARFCAGDPRGGPRMNKFERQGAILRLVAERELSTQAEVAEALREEGIDAVQTTVSRDIAQLGLVKVRNRDAKLVYALPGADDLTRMSDLAAALRRWTSSLTSTGPLVVIQTPSGYANALGQQIDAARLPDIAGTVAGDNTIFVAAREGMSGAELAEVFRHHLDGNT